MKRLFPLAFYQLRLPTIADMVEYILLTSHQIPDLPITWMISSPLAVQSQVTQRVHNLSTAMEVCKH